MVHLRRHDHVAIVHGLERVRCAPADVDRQVDRRERAGADELAHVEIGQLDGLDDGAAPLDGRVEQRAQRAEQL